MGQTQGESKNNQALNALILKPVAKIRSIVPFSSLEMILEMPVGMRISSKMGEIRN
ncbi:hypothetical protein [Alkalinema sp. FACHB-956]|uniref:hypothetical protein n=1 Tax=Alkalinema sp. FACHB-956 TaxID=2692768 RepID=UPI001689B513|nr:hypothetical protein [Alkalinema sp. FACHB-956]MBD2326773.1 hypothetical protein [Alkalinema sp. FACHB-956]